MRILITGSRDWTDVDVISAALADRAASGDRLISGACPTGADAMCEAAALRLGMELELYPADWNDCGNDCGPSHWRYRSGRPYCPRSGFTRNARMVQSGADICLAFIRNGSRGASMTADLAQKAGIETVIFRDGSAK